MKTKRSIAIVAAVFGLTLSACALGGCYSTNAIKSPSETFDTPEGAAPMLSVAHEGRYESLGAEGCFGCHGSSSEADPFLAKAGQMPDNHYVREDRDSHKIDAAHSLCGSCHVQQRKAGE